ncbi:MAG TPA: hypothetical protein VJK51_03895 [Candidatus Nanoarchaeia archaeon]|nr:hypothetical protein [Candidatus Nanoarchaeia archaeon]
MRKRIQKIPKRVEIGCPHCAARLRFEVSAEKGVQTLVCSSCEQIIRTPITQCCIVCAFSDKQCPYSLVSEARVKGMELR